MKIQLPDFSWFNTCCVFDVLQFQLCFSQGASYADDLGAGENVLSVPQCVAENMKDLKKKFIWQLPTATQAP